MLGIEETWETFFLFRCTDGRDGAGGDLAASYKELVEAAEGGQFSRRGGLGVVFLSKEGEEGPDGVDVGLENGSGGVNGNGGRGCGPGIVKGVVMVNVFRLLGRPDQESDILLQVGTVALNGVHREVAFKVEIVQELSNNWVVVHDNYHLPAKVSSASGPASVASGGARVRKTIPWAAGQATVGEHDSKLTVGG